YDLVVAIFGKAGVAPSYVQHVSQIHSILALVQAGLGAALVPETASSLRFEGIVLRPIKMQPRDPVELFLVWDSTNDNPALPAFLGIARALRPEPVTKASAPTSNRSDVSIRAF